VAELDRYNVHKLAVVDAETAAISIGGVSRANNINAFVGLLDAGFNIRAKSNGKLIILQRAR